MRGELRRPLVLLSIALVVVLGAVWLLGRVGRATMETAGSGDLIVEGTDEQRLAALRQRLIDLRVAQDTFHRHYGVFGRSVGQMRFEVPRGMTIEIIGSTAQGWAAQATVRDVDRLCAIFVGDSATWVFPPAVRPGEPACSP